MTLPRVIRSSFILILGVAAAACGGPPGATGGRGGSGGTTDAGVGGGGQTGAGGSAGSGGGAGPIGWVWSVTCPDGHEPSDPVDYGRCAVAQALAEARVARPVTVGLIDDATVASVKAEVTPLLDSRPESFVIAPLAGTTWIVGRDPVGAMYGALEVAERIRLDGAAALPPASVSRGAPAVSFRAANLFWVLPAPGEPSWWYLDPQFWRAYLDLMAHARLDVLDLHGMYDLETTGFPNALLYLARSASFPDVGAPAAERDRNLAMLNQVIAMAHARGIRVALMTYSASSSLDGSSSEGLPDADLKTYIREAAADIAARVPNLSMLGFRTGESGKSATWYEDTFVAGVRQVSPTMTLYARTWASSRPDIDSLASSIGPNMVLEAKYNAEHLGPPYAIAGGAMASWGSYSYQSYLTPPAPWSFVFQVRAGGTHQIFRQASYVRTQRAIQSLGLSPLVRGFTLEPPHAYTPQRDFYHSSADDQLSPWTFARDDLMYLLWGRLGYDPTEPEAHFRQIFAREAGTDALWPALQAGSDIVPWIVTGRTCGPDSRNFEPELELGGDVAQWAHVAGGPESVPSCRGAAAFDTFAVAAPADAAADLVSQRATSRLSPNDVAAIVLDDAARAKRTVDASGVDVAGDGNRLARDVARECQALAELGQYFGHKLRAATALAVYARTNAGDWLAAARAETMTAGGAWESLVSATTYILPFQERLRMLPLGYDPFHWSMETASLLASDGAALDAVASAVTAAPPGFTDTLPDPNVWLATARLAPPALTAFSVEPADATAPRWSVRVSLGADAPADAAVSVLWKPFDSETDWSSVPAAVQSDGSFVATIAGGGAGALFAVEIRSSAGAWRLPDVTTAIPYLSLPP